MDPHTATPATEKPTAVGETFKEISARWQRERETVPRPDDRPTHPPQIVAMRAAAGLAPLADHENVDYVTRRTLDGLSACLGARYSRERASLDRFTIYHKAQGEAVATVRAFIDRLEDNIRSGRGLILYGPVGTGKDHLLAAALYAAAALTVDCHWLSGQELYGRLRDTMDTGEREAKVMQQWTAPTVLAVSDPIPPRGEVSSWNTSQLYRLLDKRYRNLRPTWVSLNAASVEDADEKLSAPVFDRLREGAVFVRCFWPSFRERIKEGI